MSTTNLGIAHIASNQNTKEVTANLAFDSFDTAITDYLAINVAGGVDVTPASATVILEAFLDCTGLLTAAINLILPAVKRFYVIRHSATGGYPITVKTSAAGTNGTITLLPGDVKLVYSDATNILGCTASRVSQKFTAGATMPAAVDGNQTIELDATSAGFTLVIPDATKSKGVLFFVKSDSSGNLPTLQGPSSQNINGANTYTGLSAQYKYVAMFPNGTKWLICGAN